MQIASETKRTMNAINRHSLKASIAFSISKIESTLLSKKQMKYNMKNTKAKMNKIWPMSLIVARRVSQ